MNHGAHRSLYLRGLLILLLFLLPFQSAFGFVRTEIRVPQRPEIQRVGEIAQHDSLLCRGELLREHRRSPLLGRARGLHCVFVRAHEELQRFPISSDSQICSIYGSERRRRRRRRRVSIFVKLRAWYALLFERERREGRWASMPPFSPFQKSF